MRTATIAFQLQRPGDALRVKWVQVSDDGASQHREPDPDTVQVLIEALQRHAAMLATDG